MAWTTHADVSRYFSYQSPPADGIERMARLRNKARELAYEILDCTPPSADQSAAIRKLREVVQTAFAAIVLERKEAT